MIDTPYDLDAVRALDDTRLAQFLELTYTFGPSVALAWLAMCNGWRNEGIDAKTEMAALRPTAPPPVTLAFGGEPKAKPASQAGFRRKHPQPSRGSYV